MSQLPDEERDRIFADGRWHQAICDAERCIEIMNLPDAKLRPITAWQLLPQGFEASATRTILQSIPVEDHEMQAEWAALVEKLQVRLTNVKAKHKLWSTELVTAN